MSDILPDTLTVARICTDYTDGPTTASLTAICKALLEVRYRGGHTLVQHTRGCVACRRHVSRSVKACYYHPGVIKRWIKKDRTEKIFTCCGTFSSACSKLPTHVFCLRCEKCGVLIRDKSLITTRCQYHPGLGVTSTKTVWDCCGTPGFNAPGCMQGEHTIETPKFSHVGWSRLGTKALVCTTEGMLVLSYHHNVWTQHLFKYHDVLSNGYSNESAPFSRDSLYFVSSYWGSELGDIFLNNARTGRSTRICDFLGTSSYSWGCDNKYWLYLSLSLTLVLTAFDLTKKLFVDRKHVFMIPGIPYKPSLRGVQILEPYGNRILLIDGGAVLSVYQVTNNEIQINVISSVVSLMDDYVLQAFQWTNDGFVGIFERAAADNQDATHKRHKFELWRFDNALTRIAQKKLPKVACRKIEHPENKVRTLFKYDPVRNMYYFVQQQFFYIFNEAVEVVFMMQWENVEEIWFDVSSRIAIRSDGLIAQIPIPPVPESHNVALTQFGDERFVTLLCNSETSHKSENSFI